MRNVAGCAFFVLFFCLASKPCLAANAGEAVYKANCQSCHGATGMADTGPGRVTKTLPVTDAEVKNRSADEMIQFTRDGKDRMRGFKGKLTEPEIRDAVTYFRTFIK